MGSHIGKGIEMKAIELFAAMASGKTIQIKEAQGYRNYNLRIQGLIREDGSGNCWIMLADDVDFNEQLQFFVRTSDSKDGFVMRYMPKRVKVGY